MIAAFGLGLAVLAIPGPARPRGPLAAAAEPAGPRHPRGYLLSVWIGLFGFTGVRTTAGMSPVSWRWPPRGPGRACACSGCDERPGRGGAFPAGSPRDRPGGRNDRRRPGGSGAGAARDRGGRSQPGPTSGHGTALKTTTIGGTTVLTNAKGFTLYSFAPNTPSSSKCYGSCATYWPPVTGTTAAGRPFGQAITITRTGGSRQPTYNGHPLYTYIGDTTPGQAHGNNLNLNGGVWHEVPASR